MTRGRHKSERGFAACRQTKLSALLRPGLLVLIGVIAAQLGPFAHRTCGQTIIGRQGQEADEESADHLSDSRKLFITDRRMTQRLKQAQELLAEGSSMQALSLLQGVLDHDEDFFILPEAVPAEKNGEQRGAGFRSLKGEAERVLGTLPPEARAAYELQYGATARQLLKQAVESGDLSGLDEVARRFFHTEAGYEATYLLGTHHLDHNRPLAAALQFERLRKLPQAAGKWEPMLSLKTALCWQSAGLPDEARQTLLDLKSRTAGQQVTVGGRRIAFFENSEQALDWLSTIFGNPNVVRPGEPTWRMFRGDASRNASATEAVPVGRAEWAVSTIHQFPSGDPSLLQQSEAVESKLQEIASQYEQGDYLTLPAATPLVVNDVVVFRTLRNLRAVDRISGALLWETALEDPFYQMVLGEAGRSSVTMGSNQFSLLDLFLSQRAWRDMTAGTLSSDGRYVFALEHLGFLSPFFNPSQQIEFPVLAPEYNRLVAYELSTGRARLELGGPGGGADLNMAGAYFLGPPLPLADRLYVLAEVRGEIRLLALHIDASDQAHPHAGLDWSQSLLVPELALEHSPLRRLSGISPSYADGVLVCPTTSGAVVAVDLTRRALLWGYRYPTNLPEEIQPNAPQFWIQGASIFGLTGADDKARWVESAPIIARGRVLLTPRDSDELHCLSLVDGSLQWKKRRGEALYVAGVYDGFVVVVSRTEVNAYSLADGQPVWKEPAPIPMPSGRGIRQGAYYRLPLSTGEIATLDLRSGQIVARSTIPSFPRSAWERRSAFAGVERGGVVPGNLVAAGGSLVSQSLHEVVGFMPVDRLREHIQDALAHHPDDADALALRGEMRLHEGDEKAGLTDLLHTIELRSRSRPENVQVPEQSSAARADELVLATLLDGLRLDFEAYRQWVPALERLATDSRQQSAFLRRYAVGLQKRGDVETAFTQYLRLAGVDAAPIVARSTSPPRKQGILPLERVSGSLSVRSDRWIGPRIAELYQNASPSQRKDMDAQVRSLLATIEQADGHRADGRPSTRPALPQDERLGVRDRLRRFLNSFSRLPVADEARRALVDQLDDNRYALEMELQLKQLQRSGNRSLAGFATARLAALRIQQGRASEAEPLLDVLSDTYADVMCLDGKTGGELVRAWRADERIAQALREGSAWPKRPIQARRAQRQGGVQMNAPVEIVGPREPFAEHWSLALGPQQQNLVARDGTGRELWRVPVTKTGAAVRSLTGNYALMVGHLMVVVLDSRIMAIDTSAARAGAPARGPSDAVLWQKNLFEPELGWMVHIGLQMQRLGAQARGVNWSPFRSFGRLMTSVGPLTESYLCYCLGTRLYAVDPLTGEILWERRNVPRGSDLFGDEESVVIVPPDASDAIILQAADGREAATYALPKSDLWVGTQGRLVLWKQPSGGNQVLVLTDPVTGGPRWQHTFAEDAQVELIESDEAAVLEPNGRFTVLALDDGTVRFQSHVEPQPNLDSCIVRRSRDRYVLMTHAAEPERQTVQIIGLGNEPALVSGSVTAFDRATGQKLWSRRVEQQSIDLSQPADLPVLVFATRVRELSNARGLQYPNQFSLWILDARNGDVVYQRQGPEPLLPFEIQVAPDEPRIDVNFYQWQVTLTPTTPPAPQPPQAPKPKQ